MDYPEIFKRSVDKIFYTETARLFSKSSEVPRKDEYGSVNTRQFVPNMELRINFRNSIERSDSSVEGDLYSCRIGISCSADVPVCCGDIIQTRGDYYTVESVKRYGIHLDIEAMPAESFEIVYGEDDVDA